MSRLKRNNRLSYGCEIIGIDYLCCNRSYKKYPDFKTFCRYMLTWRKEHWNSCSHEKSCMMWEHRPFGIEHSMWVDLRPFGDAGVDGSGPRSTCTVNRKVLSPQAQVSAESICHTHDTLHHEIWSALPGHERWRQEVDPWNFFYVSRLERMLKKLPKWFLKLVSVDTSFRNHLEREKVWVVPKNGK